MIDWKINRDSFYKELLPTLGPKGIEDAGFFEDTAKEDVDVKESVRILCTPLSFMLPKINSKNPCILLTTGSFCPLHAGHIQMMEKAKDHLESIGHTVIGGFVSPGHDEYISAKTKEKAIPIHYRIRTIVEMTKNHDWLSVDPWEGLFCKVAVNFTDVYVRLQEYVKHHLKMDIPIFFVSGSDNARFAMTFMNKGNCVVVERPPHKEKFEYYKTMLNDYRNIHFVKGGIALSSTELRTDVFVADKKKKLVIRVENDEKIAASRLLGKYFSEVEQRHLHDQKKHFYKKMHIDEMISLDSLLRSMYSLQISRSYDLFGSMNLGFVNRPSSISIEEQLAYIPKGDYSLFDDDIHTGSTMRFAKNIFESAGYRIKEIASLNISSPDKSEILDCRDFFVGGKNSGLVVRMPDGKNVRAPYMYPYVCPFIRASVGDPMRFSIDAWQMNMDVFKGGNHKLAGYPFFHDLFLRAGFKLEEEMYEICKWHRDLLVSLI